MITIHANLKTGERRVIESCDADDYPITVFTKFLLPDIAEKLKQHELAVVNERR